MKKKKVLLVVALVLLIVGLVFIAAVSMFERSTPKIELGHLVELNDKIASLCPHRFLDQTIVERIRAKYGVEMTPAFNRMTMYYRGGGSFQVNCITSPLIDPRVIGFYKASSVVTPLSPRQNYYFSKVCESKAKQILADNSVFQ